MRTEVNGYDSLVSEALRVFEGSSIIDSQVNYSYSVNPWTDAKGLYCSIDEEEGANIYKLKSFKIEQNEEDIDYKKRKPPNTPELKAWYDQCIQKRWGHHLVLNRFVFDMPKGTGDLASIKLRTTTPPKWKNYRDDYKSVWFNDTKEVMDGLRRFIKLWSDGNKDIHSRDFVWIAATEHSKFEEAVHIHILLNELSRVPPANLKAIVGHFNDQMLSSSMTNKLKGFKLHLAKHIKPEPIEYENRVSYVLKDSEDQRKHVFTSNHFRQFLEDKRTHVFKPLL